MVDYNKLMNFKYSMFLINIIKSYQRRKCINEFKKNLLLKGLTYNFSLGCYAKLSKGSTKENIVFGDNISILDGCSIISQNGGTIILGDNVKLQRTTIMCVDRVEIGDYTALASNVVITDNNNHPINPE